MKDFGQHLFSEPKGYGFKNCKYCYLVIFIFKLFVALQGKWKKLFRFLQLLRAKLFPSPYIYEQTCSFSLQNYEQTCSLSLQNYEQGVQDFKNFNFGGLFLLTGAPNEKEYNMGCHSFCPLFHPLEYRFPVLFPFTSAQVENQCDDNLCIAYLWATN